LDHFTKTAERGGLAAAPLKREQNEEDLVQPLGVIGGDEKAKGGKAKQEMDEEEKEEFSMHALSVLVERIDVLLSHIQQIQQRYDIA
jgi:hypothetical protein